MPDRTRPSASHATPPAAVATPAPMVDPSGLDPSGARGNAFAIDQLAAHDASGGGAGYTPANVRAAVARQERGRQMVSTLISSAASIAPNPGDPLGRPTMLRNTAQWVLAGEIQLQVLGPLHDGARRGVPAGMRGYFGGGVPYTTAPPAYDPATTTFDAATMVQEPASVKASVPSGGTVIQLLDPVGYGEADLGTTLIHEVQHDADHHDDVIQPSSFSLTTADPSLYALYASEFRAYWLQAAEGTGGDTFQRAEDPADAFDVTANDPNGGTRTVSASGLQNQRQASILLQLTRESPGVSGTHAPGTTVTAADFDGPYGFVTHYYVFDAAFRSFVNGLVVPMSTNMVNSIRLEALFDALKAGDPTQIGTAIGSLDSSDIAILFNVYGESPMWAQIASHPAAAAVLGTAMATGLRGPSTATVTVQAGDTLESIARRVLGDDIFVSDIRDANPTARLPRSDTGRLTAGLVLNLPSGRL